jgi:hypothetical protein
MFVAVTPLLLMLIFAIPDENKRDFLRLLIFSSFLTAFLLIGIAGLLGNLYYYYDHRKQGFKFMIHCGKGPRDHYFGDSLFPPAVDSPSPKRNPSSPLPTPPFASSSKHHKHHHSPQLSQLMLRHDVFDHGKLGSPADVSRGKGRRSSRFRTLNFYQCSLPPSPADTISQHKFLGDPVHI